MKILLAGCLLLTAFLGGCTTPEDQGLTTGDRCGVISHTSHGRRRIDVYVHSLWSGLNQSDKAACAKYFYEQGFKNNPNNLSNAVYILNENSQIIGIYSEGKLTTAEPQERW
jgi:hypothetical protein